MAYASQVGRARTSTTNPQAHAICMRCGFRHNFVDLTWQYEWRGPLLQNTRVLVCRECLDVPQENVRSITLPADPESIIYAQPELYAQDSTDYFGTGQPTVNPQTGIAQPSPNVLGGASSSDTIVPQPVGPSLLPNAKGQLIPSSIGVDSNAQMTPVKDVQWDVKLPILSIVGNGTPIISISCSSPHGLTTGAQISILGTSNPLIFGIYTATVKTATLFTVQANANVANGSYGTPSTIVATTNAGLPWSLTQVPQTGV